MIQDQRPYDVRPRIVGHDDLLGVDDVRRVGIGRPAVDVNSVLEVARLALKRHDVVVPVAVQIADHQIQRGVRHGLEDAHGQRERAAGVAIQLLARRPQSGDQQVEVSVVVEVQEFAVVVVLIGIRAQAGADVGVAAAPVVFEQDVGVAAVAVGAHEVEVTVAVDVAEIVGVAGAVRRHAAVDRVGAAAVVTVEPAVVGARAGGLDVQVEVAVDVAEDAVHVVADATEGELRGRDVGEVAVAVVFVQAVLAAGEAAGRARREEQVQVAVVVHVPELAARAGQRDRREPGRPFRGEETAAVVDQQVGQVVEVLRQHDVQVAVVVAVPELDAAVQAGQSTGPCKGLVGEDTAAVVDVDADQLRCARSGEVAAVGEDDVQVAVAIQIAEGGLVGELGRVGHGKAGCRRLDELLCGGRGRDQGQAQQGRQSKEMARCEGLLRGHQAPLSGGRGAPSDKHTENSTESRGENHLFLRIPPFRGARAHKGQGLVGLMDSR